LRLGEAPTPLRTLCESVSITWNSWRAIRRKANETVTWSKAPFVLTSCDDNQLFLEYHVKGRTFGANYKTLALIIGKIRMSQLDSLVSADA
jgi:hypothetical protein